MAGRTSVLRNSEKNFTARKNWLESGKNLAARTEMAGRTKLLIEMVGRTRILGQIRRQEIGC
jgi:hypothetical protein